MVSNLQPCLSNELVLIRPLRSDDYEALYQVASDPLIWEQHTTSDRWKSEGFLNFFEESLQSKGSLVIIAQKSNLIIGSSRFKKSPKSNDAVEIGWSFLAREYWGGTYNRSFKSLMLNHAFTYWKYVVFLIAFSNIRSQNATIKLGGRKIEDGNLSFLKDKVQTHFTYIIEKENWTNLI